MYYGKINQLIAVLKNKINRFNNNIKKYIMKYS